MILRYILRHIPRALMKSLLSLMLAAALIAALGQFIVIVDDANARVDKLYGEIEVKAVVVAKDGTRGGGIPYYALYDLLADEFADSYYATAAASFHWLGTAAMMSDPTYEFRVDRDNFYTTPYSLVGTNDPLRTAGSPIEFLDGYDADGFARSAEYICLVERRACAEQNIALGDEVLLSGLSPGDRRMVLGDVKTGVAFKVVGIYDCMRMFPGDIILPLTVLDRAQSDLFFTAAPEVNFCEFRVKNELLRNESVYRSAPTATLESAAPDFTLRYLDDALRNTVRPLESNANTLRLLLPIIAVVVLLIGAAIPGLIVLQSAKDAAIMRVLGMSKAKVRAILVVEQMTLCAIGLATGVTVLCAAHGAERLVGLPVLMICVAGYAALAAAVCAAGSVAVSARKPLELLQTRE